MIKNTILASGFVLASISAYNQDFDWGISLGGVSTELPNAIVSDPSNDCIYVTGFFFNEIDMNPGPDLIEFGSAGASDIFLVKFDTEGNYIWANQLGGADFDDGVDLAVDQSGNVLLLIDDDKLGVNKYDSDGTLLWSYETEGMGSPAGKAMVLDSDDNVYITGNFLDTVDFNADVAEEEVLIADVFSDGFILKLTEDGSFDWVQQIIGDQDVSPSGIDLSDDGDIYLTGYFNGTVDLNPGSETASYTAASLTDVYVLRLNSSGDFEWASVMAGASSTQTEGIAVDTEGNSYITGHFNGEIDFDPSEDEELMTPFGEDDIFVQKLDVDGNLVWVHQFGGVSFDLPKDLILDENENILVTGNFTGIADFDPTEEEYLLYVDDELSSTSFVFKITSDGLLKWAVNFESNSGGFNTGASLDVDDENNIYITGGYWWNIDMDPGISEAVVNAADLYDIYLVKLNLNTSGLEVHESVTMNLYPNPSRGEFYLDVPEGSNVQILSIDGKLIKEFKSEIGKKYDFSGVNRGQYFVKVQSGSQVETLKLVVN
ncbi:MAG: SBBP repeat-containing protein [Flavobacteriales bacterium]|nr:SBBP repeat-containing protein [Flavobacteriales bacterium]